MEKGLKEFVTKRYLVLVMVSFIVALVSIISTSQKSLTLLPGETEHTDSVFQIATYADKSEPNGNSRISPVYQNGNGVSYKYTIKEGIEYPYAGLSFDTDPKNSSLIEKALDISKYNAVKMVIHAKNSAAEQMIIKTTIPKFTKSKDTRSSLTTTINFTNGVFDGSIPLSKFSTPDWWFTSRKTSKANLASPDFSEVFEIVFQNGYDVKSGQEVSVEIKEITFIKDRKSQLLTTILVFLLVIILLSSIRFIKRPVVAGDDNGSEKIIISYDRVEIEDEQNNDVQRITEFIASNYANAEFSVEQLAKGAGVSTSKIPTMLKKHFSMNFKQYLNTVRITEAKRLLLETDHQIVTIAHSVGYNNIPHFNRTFKQVTGLSPKKYRENPDDAIDNLPGSHNK